MIYTLICGGSYTTCAKSIRRSPRGPAKQSRHECKCDNILKIYMLICGGRVHQRVTGVPAKQSRPQVSTSGKLSAQFR